MKEYEFYFYYQPNPTSSVESCAKNSAWHKHFTQAAFGLQCSGQVYQCNITIVEVVRQYVANNLRERNLHTGILTYAYSTRTHWATRFAPLELTLSSSTQPLAVRPTAKDRQAITAIQNLHRWEQRLAQLTHNAGKKWWRSNRNMKKNLIRGSDHPTKQQSLGDLYLEGRNFTDSMTRSTSCLSWSKFRLEWYLEGKQHQSFELEKNRNDRCKTE